MSVYRLHQIFADHFGVDAHARDAPPEVDQFAMRLSRARWSLEKGWGRSVDAEIAGIIEDARRLQARVAALDGYALARARRSVPEVVEAHRRLDAAAASGDAAALLSAAADACRPRPQEAWVDFAAMAALDALVEALGAPAEQAAQARAAEAGDRRKDPVAHVVAEQAALAFLHFTGEKPGYWNGSTTPFARFLRDVFDALGIKTELRAPAIAAIHSISAIDVWRRKNS